MIRSPPPPSYAPLLTVDLHFRTRHSLELNNESPDSMRTYNRNAIQIEQCDNCRYYLEPTASISYCWHQKLRILVGATWWCQWWEKIEE